MESKIAEIMEILNGMSFQIAELMKFKMEMLELLNHEIEANKEVLSEQVENK